MKFNYFFLISKKKKEKNPTMEVRPAVGGWRPWRRHFGATTATTTATTTTATTATTATTTATTTTTPHPFRPFYDS